MTSPNMDSPDPTHLAVEQATLQQIVGRDTDLARSTQRQLAASTIARRERSDDGFVSHFQVPSTAPRIAPAEFEVSASAILATGETVSFTLVVENGQLDRLEASTFGDPWPQRPVIREWTYLPDD